MKKTKLSKRTIALLAAAVVLLAGGGYTGTRAALTVTSLNQKMAFVTDNQNVTLMNDKGAVTADNPLLGSEKLAPGKPAAVGLKVKNTSNASQYVRVVVKKYWEKDGEKVTSFTEDENGKVAELDMVSFGIGSSKWKINDAETTPERTVYYYTSEIASGSQSDVLIKDVTVSSDVLKSVTSTNDGIGTTTYTYVFDDYTLCIKAEAQAVQTHNGADAIRSVWGVEASDVGIPAN